jgi:hypothetical protein
MQPGMLAPLARCAKRWFCTNQSWRSRLVWPGSQLAGYDRTYDGGNDGYLIRID